MAASKGIGQVRGVDSCIPVERCHANESFSVLWLMEQITQLLRRHLSGQLSCWFQYCAVYFSKVDVHNVGYSPSPNYNIGGYTALRRDSWETKVRLPREAAGGKTLILATSRLSDSVSSFVREPGFRILHFWESMVGKFTSFWLS